MTRLIATRLRGHHDDRGVTLPELLVTMLLMSILSLMVVGMVAGFSRTFAREREATDSTTIASAGMKEVTRVVRAATEIRPAGEPDNVPAFIDARPNELTLYAYIDTAAAAPKPVKVRFWIDPQRRLMETRWVTTSTASPWSFPATGAPTTVRPIARSLPVTAPAVFEYLDKDNEPMAIPAGGFSDAQKRLIAAVRVTLTVQTDPTGRAKAVTMRNAVGVPNRALDRVRATP
ncbi:type II secretion system protein J [Cellulomonas sp. JZ18]|uniref:PulJ/GspJ family protein n=1 Tax=Cellulomonas sp. JZ18 TaxID=2654191 RepID=UPI0018AF665A|nr:prepilin-type N-terminal cleavage/methylation domain-containing protein [Cellulomonas sp. JZ18]